MLKIILPLSYSVRKCYNTIKRGCTTRRYGRMREGFDSTWRSGKASYVFPVEGVMLVRNVALETTSQANHANATLSVAAFVSSFIILAFSHARVIY